MILTKFASTNRDRHEERDTDDRLFVYPPLCPSLFALTSFPTFISKPSIVAQCRSSETKLGRFEEIQWPFGLASLAGTVSWEGCRWTSRSAAAQAGIGFTRIRAAWHLTLSPPPPPPTRRGDRKNVSTRIGRGTIDQKRAMPRARVAMQSGLAPFRLGQHESHAGSTGHPGCRTEKILGFNSGSGWIARILCRLIQV